MNLNSEPIVIINILTPRPGQIDAVIEHQQQAQKRFAGAEAGWRGSRLHRAENNKTVAIVTVFDSIEHHRQWLQDEEFLKHRESLLPLVEKIEPVYYHIVDEAGRIQE